MQHLSNILIALTLLIASACAESSTSSTTEQTDAAPAAQGATASSNEPVLTVLNDTIASPLKQLTMNLEGDVKLAITYGSPSAKGRTIWGGLVPYAEVWRTGANEATTFEVSAPVMVAGQELPAGKYGLFTIPGESDWTLIFNSVADQWGAYQYDETKDVLRAKVVPQTGDKFSETMEFGVDEAGTIFLTWGQVSVPFTIAKA